MRELMLNGRPTLRGTQALLTIVTLCSRARFTRIVSPRTFDLSFLISPGKAYVDLHAFPFDLPSIKSGKVRSDSPTNDIKIT